MTNAENQKTEAAQLAVASPAVVALQEQGNSLPGELQIGRELVATLDTLLASGAWEHSLFLRTIKKRVQDIINDTLSAIENVGGIKKVVVQDRFTQIVSDGHIRVYILMYQTEGGMLSNWQYALKTLLECNISRPTYRNGDDIQELIRSKKDVERYGYAVVNVAEKDIYSQSTALKDVLDHEMIALKENAVKRENVIGFVHANKKRYSFVDGALIYRDDL
jgi:Dot/Icm secretion system protein IcmQ